MAIKSSTFSGWQLSDKDADAFLKQVNESKANPLAQAAVKRGQNLAIEYIQKGSVTIHAQQDKNTAQSQTCPTLNLQDNKNKS